MNNLSTFTLDQIHKASDLAHKEGYSLDEALSLVRSRDQKSQRAKNKELNDLLKLDIRQMSKTEVIEATWKLPEMHSTLYEMLKEQGGFMTGSNVTSNIIDPKDEDWCVQMPPSVFHGCSLGQSDHGYWEADGFSSVYCHHNKKLINIICFSDRELFNAWYFATKTISSLKNTILDFPTYPWQENQLVFSDMLATKWKRVILFRALKDIAYEPRPKRPMDHDDALKYQKCKECSREAIYFTCKAAKDHYLMSAICERCADITY